MKDRVCIITGGASGIGKAMVEAFAKEGCKVFLLDINYDEGLEVEKEQTQLGFEVKAFEVDISNHLQMQEVVQKINEIAGRIDILINNAGIAHIGTVENTNEEDLDRIYRVNIKGVYNGIHACIPLMKEHGGCIINMSSVAVGVGLPDRFAYSMSKAAVENMTYTVARDYINFGIRCNSIAPARVHTPFVDKFITKNYPGEEKEVFDKLSKTQPIGRMGKPSEVAQLAVYLCSDAASFITGSNFPIDGGFIKLNT